MSAQESRDATWFTERLPEPDALAELLGDDPVAALLAEIRTRAPIEVGVDPSLLSAAERAAVETELAAAATAAAKLRLHPKAPLDPDEVRALDALVHLVARPALRLIEGELAEVPRPWPKLHRARFLVTDLAPAIGRIDTPGRQAVGTGWFAAPGLLLTNAHVAAQLCGIDVHSYQDTWQQRVLDRWKDQNQRWAAAAETRPVWDPADDPSAKPPAGATARPPARIPRIRAVHDRFDMALLEIEGVDDPPDPLTLSLAAPPDLIGRDVYVTGYPLVDGSKFHPALARMLFGASLNGAVKRVAPGRLCRLADADVEHDASTLAGNSGSPVIDLALHRVYVLHARGYYGIANHGVALWQVQTDPFFTDNGLQFEA